MDDGGYLLDNRAEETGLRFDSLSALFNPGTFRIFEQVGVSPSWRCWEVGVGGPSIPTWLADRVGPTGHVLGTDIDPRWARPANGPTFEVVQHDVVNEPPPGTAFDLVHARLVLIHLPDRERVVKVLASALRPGGWLVLEDFDSLMQPNAVIDPTTPDDRVANQAREGFRALLEGRGVDLAWGRRLPGALRGVGLVDVGADAYCAVARPAGVPMELANVRQTRDDLVEGGHLSAEEVDQYLAQLDSGALEISSPLMISAWGRRPPSPA